MAHDIDNTEADVAAAFEALNAQQPQADVPERPNIDKGENGWAKEIEVAMAEVADGTHAQDEFGAIYAPHKEALDRSGMTGESYTRKLIALGQHLEHDPQGTLDALSDYYLYGNRESGHPADHYYLHSEWERFAGKHSDAHTLREALAAELNANPEKKGESPYSALTRAYRHVKKAAGKK